MEKHACKLCFKLFPIGRALGAHMRCHAAASDETPPPLEGRMQSYGLRENPRKSVRLADAHFSSPFAVFDAALDDGSYSIGSHADFNRQRSNRRRRSPPDPPEPVSSASDVTTEEDVAISLVLLSREAWLMEEAEKNEPIAVSDDHSAAAVEQIVAGKRRRSMPEPPQAVQCEHCRKKFSSCQALGGHRASYKKMNVSCAAAADAVLVDAEADLRHECGICSRVFSSGQALGGHKRAHLCSSSIITTVASSSSPLLPRRADFSFDLYLLPPDRDSFGN